ncbi:MAG: electron transfer flavoprotein subunit alpha/FixB family protein [Actinobacteria bacterium]|nr:electron transfer flavoprotein subunit alpha/FixB family protein [Actinomycetota bacterium]
MLCCVVEHDRGSVGEVGLELLSTGHRVASELGVTHEAIVIGPGAGDAVERFGAYGVDRAHIVEHAQLDSYAPDAYADSVAQLIAAHGPVAVLASGTEKGNEVLAHVAARTGLPMAANCTEVTPGDAGGDDAWTLTRMRWGGSLLEDARLEASTKLLTLAPHAFEPAQAAEAGDVEVAAFEPQLDEATSYTRVVAHEPSGGGVSLASAPVVVSGGRGVGSADGFDMLEQLAGLLGGAVGCSRVATNNGWRSHSDQVGQTGTKIAPQLYIACGISGATQHWVGCKDAKNILAINTDPEAPLVTRGNYAVVGNLHEILPAIVDEVRRRKTTA